MAKEIDTSSWTKEEIKQGFAIRRRGGKSVIKISAKDGTIEHLSRTKRNKGLYEKLSKRISKKKREKTSENDDLKTVKRIQNKLDKTENLTSAEKEWQKQLAETRQRLENGESRESIVKDLNEKATKMTDEEINKALDNIKSIGKDDDDFYDPRKEAKYWLEKGEFDKFDKQLKDYGLEEERDEFLGGVNSRIEKDYKEYSDKQKYLSIPEKERVQAYVDGKNWRDLVKEKEIDTKTAEVMLKGTQRSIEFEKDGLARAKRDGQNVENISDRTRRLHELELQEQKDKEHFNRMKAKENDIKSKFRAKQQMDQLHQMQKEELAKQQSKKKEYKNVPYKYGSYTPGEYTKAEVLEKDENYTTLAIPNKLQPTLNQVKEFNKEFKSVKQKLAKQQREVNGIKLLSIRKGEEGTYIEDLVNQYNKYAREGNHKYTTFQSLKKEIAERRKK